MIGKGKREIQKAEEIRIAPKTMESTYYALEIKNVKKEHVRFRLDVNELLVSIICGCMKTVVESFGTMICAHVFSMIVIGMYMLIEKSLLPIICVGYLVLYIGILCTVMFLLISQRKKMFFFTT